MVDVAELTAWRDKLKKARYVGLRVVEYDGMRIEYKSDTEMADAIAALDREISGQQATPVTTLRLLPGKGL